MILNDGDASGSPTLREGFLASNVGFAGIESPEVSSRSGRWRSESKGEDGGRAIEETSGSEESSREQTWSRRASSLDPKSGVEREASELFAGADIDEEG